MYNYIYIYIYIIHIRHTTYVLYIYIWIYIYIYVYIYMYTCSHLCFERFRRTFSKVVHGHFFGQGARKSQTNLPHHLGLSKPWGQMASTKSGNHGRWHDNGTKMMEPKKDSVEKQQWHVAICCNDFETGNTQLKSRSLWGRCIASGHCQR